MIHNIISMLRANVHVAIVTAAGYPGAPERFEQVCVGVGRWRRGGGGGWEELVAWWQGRAMLLPACLAVRASPKRATPPLTPCSVWTACWRRSGSTTSPPPSQTGEGG